MKKFTKVGKCPYCGAPIYRPTLWNDVFVPPPLYRCCGCPGNLIDGVRYVPEEKEKKETKL